MKARYLAGAFAALTACDVPEPVTKGAFVPLAQVYAENADKPFECVGYKASSESCEGLGRSVIRGNTVTSTTLFALDEGLPATIKVVTRHRVKNGRACGIIGRAKVTVESDATPEAAAAVSNMFTVLMTDMIRDLCIGYYRSGEGYYVETTTLNGEVVPDLTETGISRFFATQKKLRNMKL